MKKALFKDSIKEIKNTYKRFISILLMAFLGVGFFAGVRATSPDMLDTIDIYYKNQNMYDIQIISTLGLTIDDLNSIKKIDGVLETYGSYSTDEVIIDNNSEHVIKIMSIEEINKPILKEGRMPSEPNECVVESKMLSGLGKNIGDEIHLKENDESLLSQNKLKIVGIVESPIYISMQRGNTSLGAGSINYYTYVPKESFNSDLYTEIYIKVKDASKYETSTDRYENLVENVKNNIDNIKEERQKIRYDNLIDTAEKELEKAQNEFNEEKKSAEEQIAEAEKKINDAKKEVEENENKINNGEVQANKEFANAEKLIKQGKEEIYSNEKLYDENKEKAEEEINKYENTKQELTNNLNTINTGIEQIDIKYNEIQLALSNPQLSEEQKNQLENTAGLLEKQKSGLEQNKNEIENGIEEINNGISSAKEQLKSAEKQIENAKIELKEQEQNLEKEKSRTYSKLENGKKEIEEAKLEIQKGEEELNINKQEFEKQITDAEEKLNNAKEQISEIESPTWYILDRYGNTGYNSFIQDVHSIENIGKVFPIVFFVIATLISLTSMTRMVEEQRGQIGTLKALGYNRMQIASKYIIYSAVACIIGGILGMCVGFMLIPKVIWMMYEMMYTITDIHLKFNTYYALFGLGVACICIVGATAYSTNNILKYEPATLMRPRAPKIGKRVILEKIPFIWNKLSFSHKVTVRNIFRYKKRFLMTIIGILGCTALIVAGFGLKNSIESLLPKQYGKVFKYNMQVSLKNGVDVNSFLEKVRNNEKIKNITETNISAGELTNKDSTEEIQIIVPKNADEIKNSINIIDLKTNESVELLDDGIYVTDKVAELLEISEGDIITIKNSDDIEKQVKVNKIVENYVSHYVYMTRNTYEKLFEDNYSTNIIYINTHQMEENDEENLAKEIINYSEVSGVILTSTVRNAMNDTLKSLNYVVVVLIVSAGLLAFVVLYNLSNVNISERIRELATIKVLGFYDKEVYSYITRETILLTIIGIILGLVAGYFLNSFIISTCEINMLRFAKIINPESYVYGVLITFGFATIVNIFTYFALKKINMIESLKSVE